MLSLDMPIERLFLSEAVIATVCKTLMRSIVRVPMLAILALAGRCHAASRGD
jgi:hypothetical protein